MSDQNETPFDDERYLRGVFENVLWDYDYQTDKIDRSGIAFKLTREVLKGRTLVKLPEPRKRWSGEDGYPAHNVENRGDAEVYFDEDGAIAWTSIPLPLPNADAAEGFAAALLACAKEWRRINSEVPE
jgi:hypothetical protein